MNNNKEFQINIIVVNKLADIILWITFFFIDNDIFIHFINAFCCNDLEILIYLILLQVNYLESEIIPIDINERKKIRRHFTYKKEVKIMIDKGKGKLI